MVEKNGPFWNGIRSRSSFALLFFVSGFAMDAVMPFTKTIYAFVFSLNTLQTKRTKPARDAEPMAESLASTYIYALKHGLFYGLNNDR